MYPGATAVISDYKKSMVIFSPILFSNTIKS